MYRPLILNFSIFLMTIGIASVLITCSDNEENISGIVYDRYFKPIEGALVYCGSNVTTTDNDGTYRIHNIDKKLKMVTALKKCNGRLSLHTKVADATVFDFYLSGCTENDKERYGTFKGTIKGVSDNYPDTSIIGVYAVSSEGRIAGTWLHNGSLTFELNCFPSTDIFLLVLEENQNSDFYNRVMKYYYCPGIALQENEEIYFDINLNAAKFEQVFGTFPIEYYDEYRATLATFISIQGIFSYDITPALTEVYDLKDLENGAFSIDLVQDIGNSLSGISIEIERRLSGSEELYRQFFQSSHEVPESRIVNFTEPVTFIDILEPIAGAEYVGNNPIIRWSSDYTFHKISLSAEKLEWILETQSKEIQLPSFDIFKLTDYNRLLLTISSYSDFDESFPSIDLNRTVPLTNTTSSTIQYLYPNMK